MKSKTVHHCAYPGHPFSELYCWPTECAFGLTREQQMFLDDLHSRFDRFSFPEGNQVGKLKVYGDLPHDGLVEEPLLIPATSGDLLISSGARIRKVYWSDLIEYGLSSNSHFGYYLAVWIEKGRWTYLK